MTKREGCECDNTHHAVDSVCQWCYEHGRRHWSDLDICDRCERPVNAWPLKRGARCSPSSWARCIRNDGHYAASVDRKELQPSC